MCTTVKCVNTGKSSVMWLVWCLKAGCDGIELQKLLSVGRLSFKLDGTARNLAADLVKWDERYVQELCGT